jgi:hypothetical protein
MKNSNVKGACVSQNAISRIDREMLRRVWSEMDYRFDVCHFTKGGHRAFMMYAKQTWRVSLSIGMLHVTILCSIQVYQYFVMFHGITNNPVQYTSVGLLVIILSLPF